MMKVFFLFFSNPKQDTILINNPGIPIPKILLIFFQILHFSERFELSVNTYNHHKYSCQ